MSLQPFSAAWPSDFSGRVSLFPLPNAILFPNSILPLHIFEPRYCEMLTDALASDRLIAMAVLKPDWQAHYDQRPQIERSVCVGKIVSHTPCDNDRHNILMLGLKRARITRELDSPKMYRVAEVEVLEDYYPDDPDQLRQQLTQDLQNSFMRFVPDGLAAQDSFQQLIGQPIPLGTLTDAIAHVTNLPMAIKLQLLAEANVDSRCRLLMRCLEQRSADSDASAEISLRQDVLAGNFPPPFSEN
ncbi:MAG: LON peptidase substrate-binding domain-containing protein [Pirellulaceae bacterium]|nr:LON peptidase substrate-binding domain-containing protein [Pirellulaceae bacterium]